MNVLYMYRKYVTLTSMKYVTMKQSSLSITFFFISDFRCVKHMTEEYSEVSELSICKNLTFFTVYFTGWSPFVFGASPDESLSSSNC